MNKREALAKMMDDIHQLLINNPGAITPDLLLAYGATAKAYHEECLSEMAMCE